MKQKHKKAKLLKRLKRGGADDVVVASDNDGGDAISFKDSVSFSDVLGIFAPKLEELTDELMNELRLKGKGIDAKELEEMRQMGLKYNRKRDSFTDGKLHRF
jgi:hypothetical protein